ncbi:hypothetical protein [Bradyrhizobium liaoningense]|jgi:hypothetical protein|uniref:hypothetical protein n=1 Tax=Bradyrhizobium liaoningense TaxID=43992 RepID=UPI001BADEEF3|nr:hypothetical protein [Bradyrhizobium liaoningense]MBR0715062.1 hypothetical protein [Bradyrhizobium liaoningense]
MSGGSEFVIISRTVSGFRMRAPSSSPPFSREFRIVGVYPAHPFRATFSEKTE